VCACELSATRALARIMRTGGCSQALEGGPMSKMILACPECDSSDVYRRTFSVSSHPTDGARYRCQSCCARFDEPTRRARKTSGPSINKGTLARRLMDADADEVSA